MTGNDSNGVYPWQQSAWRAFLQATSDNHLAHALMVTGFPGSGLDWFAACQCRHLLQLNQPVDAMTELVHPDLLWIRREVPDSTNRLKDIRPVILVEQIRRLSDYLYQKPSGQSKVAVVELIENCNENAANALLKPLEEPAFNSFVILLSQAAGRVLPTIRSRCIQIRTERPSIRTAKEWLQAEDDKARDWALWLTGSAPVDAQLLLREGKIDQLMEADRRLRRDLAQRRFDYSLIQDLEGHPPLLVNQLLLRLLLDAAQPSPTRPPSVALSRLPLISLYSLMRDCMDRRKLVLNSTSLNSGMLLTGQIVLWLEALRENT